jgi:hypothetical protein
MALVKGTEKALVKETEIAIAMEIEIPAQKAIARIAPMEEVLTATVIAMPSPVVRVAETQMVIPDLSREIRAASLSDPGLQK